MSARDATAVIASFLARLLAGAALVGFAASYIHIEMHRAAPSNIRLGAFGAVGLLGLLIAPTIGVAVTTAASTALRLYRDGRRATDNVVAVVEPSPPPQERGP